MLAPLALSPPRIVLVAPPVVLNVLVVLAAPMGLPPKFMVPPPLPPVKLNAVLFQRLLLLVASENVDALTTLTFPGVIQASADPGLSVSPPLSTV